MKPHIKKLLIMLVFIPICSSLVVYSIYYALHVSPDGLVIPSNYDTTPIEIYPIIQHWKEKATHYGFNTFFILFIVMLCIYIFREKEHLRKLFNR
jgi:uncharacterized membrane protein